MTRLIASFVPVHSLLPKFERNEGSDRIVAGRSNPHFRVSVLAHTGRGPCAFKSSNECAMDPNNLLNHHQVAFALSVSGHGHVSQRTQNQLVKNCDVSIGALHAECRALKPMAFSK